MGILTALLSLPYRAVRGVLGTMGYEMTLRSHRSHARFRDGINLNIGAGHYHIPGFVSLDYISDYYHGGTTSTAGIVHYDIRSDALPYGDETVSNVYASHVIEHVENEHVERFLSEAHRVLKPGGVLRIACPDARFLYEVSSFENEYWNWRREQFMRDSRYEVRGEITQSDFLTRELASVKMRHYRHAAGETMPAFDVGEKSYGGLLEAYKSGLTFNPERPGEHINAWDMSQLHASGVAAGFKRVIESKHRGSVSAAMQGPDMDRTQPHMSLYVEMIKG